MADAGEEAAPQIVGTFGRCDIFDEQSDSWPIYAERLELYFEANQITTQNKKRAVLLTVLSAKTYMLLRNIVSPSKLTSKTYDELIDALTQHYQPKPAVTVERSKFDSRNRKPNETIGEYIAELKRLSEFCQFNQNLEDRLKDRLVCGVNNDTMQQRLFAEPNLTYVKAVEILTNMEAATRNQLELKGHKPEAPTINYVSTQKGANEINRSKNTRRPQNNNQTRNGQSYQQHNHNQYPHQSFHQGNPTNYQSRGQPIRFNNQPRHPSSTNNNTHQFRNYTRQPMTNNVSDSTRISSTREQRLPSYQRIAPCIRCNNFGHLEYQCAHIHATCQYCSKRGHLERACLKKQFDNKGSRSTHQQNNSRVNHLEAPSEIERGASHDDFLAEYNLIASLDALEANHGTQNENPPSNCHQSLPPAIKVQCKINGFDVSLQLDTGSATTLLSEQTAHGIIDLNDLKPFSVNLNSFTGHKVLNILGETEVTVTYNGMSCKLPVLVYHGRGPHLCGRTWIYSTLNILPNSQVNPSTTSINTLEPKDAASKINRLLEKHAEVFAPGLGHLKGFQAHISLKPDAEPKFCKARSIPYSLKSKVEQELDRLEANGIISSVAHSDYASPIVPVVKPDGSIRICGDYKTTINPAINIDTYPLPKAEDIFTTLAGCKYFSKIDLKEAYNQIELDEASRKLTVINTPKGLYQYNRLPYGVSSASAIFQRAMETILRGLPDVTPFQDDTLIGGKDVDHNLHRLDKVLSIFQENGLKLRKEKCAFLQKSIHFLGYLLDAEGLHPHPSKLAAIKEAPPPNNVEELRAFLGLLNYYGRFLPNNSTRLDPLHQLLHKDVPWRWTERESLAFQDAKDTLTESNILAHYDVNKEVYLACDASPVGVGAVLSHYHQGVEQPICFASRSLTKPERNYSQIEKEALAIIFGVTKFREYLLGRHFTLITDHQPLVSIFSEQKPVPQMAAARLQRWALTLAAYSYTIKFKKGCDNSNADALSRLPLSISDTTKTPLPTEFVLLLSELNKGPITAHHIERATVDDPLLATVKRYLITRWPAKVKPELTPYKNSKDELSNLRGILLRGNRVIIPTIYRKPILEDLHSSHQGIVQMKAIARAKIWWPNIDSDIENVSRLCKICQENMPMPARQYQPWPVVNKPWYRVHADFAGPIENKFIFLMVDSYSKWIELKVTSSTSTDTIIPIIRENIARYGLMAVLVTDNGPCFTSAAFQEFVGSQGINHIRTAPYHPASNGQAERSVRSVKSLLKKLSGGLSPEVDLLNSGLRMFPAGPLETRLTRILINHRRSPTANGKTPAEMMFGRPLITSLDLLHPDHRLPLMESSIHTPSRHFQLNDFVYAANFGKGPKWLEGHIVRIVGNLMFEIDTPFGRIRRHLNQLRKRLPSHRSHNPDVSTDHTTASPVPLHWSFFDTPASPPLTAAPPPAQRPASPQVIPPLRRSTRIRHAPQRLLALM